MFKRGKMGLPLLVVMDHYRRQKILQVAHERLGHRGVHEVFHHLKDRFYWPYLYQDVKHHVSVYHECQIWSTNRREVSPTIRLSATLFTQIYVDVMFMSNGRGYHYLVAARDDLSHAAKEQALR